MEVDAVMIKNVRAQKRMRRTGGFTLVEMLVTTIILLLLTGALVTGMNLAATQQRKSVFRSQAGALQSTIDNALADPLRFMVRDTSGRAVDAGSTVYKITYRDDKLNFIEDANPQLVVGDGSDWHSFDALGNETTFTSEVGHLYLKGLSPMDGNNGKQYVYIKLLNAGAYGGTGGGNSSAHCVVELVGADGNTADSISLAPDNESGVVTVSFRLKSAQAGSDMATDVITLTYKVVPYGKDSADVYGVSA